MMKLLCLPLIAVLAADSSGGTKDLVNGSIRASRALQNDDGSYGPAALQPLTTARLLQALGNCHEHYTSQDGPFVRRAVEALIAHQQPDGAFAPTGNQHRIALTAEALLALNCTATSATYDGARQKTRGFLTAHARDQNLDQETVALVERALGDRGAELTQVSRYLETGERLDAAGAWLATTGGRVAQAQQAALLDLDREGIPALTDRLLALIEIYGVEQSLSRKSDELAPMPKRAPPRSAAEALDRIRAAITFLNANQTDGRFGMGGHADPGITGLALSALIRICDRNQLPRPEYVGQGLEWLVSLQKSDGGIYQLGLKNYITSISVEALAASGDARYEQAIQKAVGFLTTTQLDEGEGYSSEQDPYYGGFGYGGSEKPDLSNTQMALQALHEAGLDQRHESYLKAIQFLNLCQNRGETGISSITLRDGTIVTAGTDGGAVYRPGNSKAGNAPTNVEGDDKVFARSYGSMTYALLKSYLFAGLDPSEPRVQEAVHWISQNFTLEVNPGFEGGRKSAPYQGLYYYYVTLARALAAVGVEQVTDASGAQRAWRRELRETLFSLQAQEGSWTNQRSSRWMEGNPVLSTAYALLALSETR